MPKPGPSLFPASGVLVQDQTWGGLIRVEGDVIVPAGVTLAIAPGAAVDFSLAPVFHCDERRPRLDSNKCSILVLGRLIADGPVTLGSGAEWGGLHFLGKGEGRLAGVRLENSVSHGISLWDEAFVDMDDAELRRCWTGVGAYGSSRLRLRGGLIEGMRESGVIVDGARASLEKLVSRGHAVADVHLRGGGRASIEDGHFSQSRSGVIAENGSVHVGGSVFSGHASAAFDLRQGEHRLERLKASGPSTGLYVGSARVTASNVEAAFGEAAVVVSKEGILEWRGGGWNAGKTGCLVLGGQVSLESLVCSGAHQGVRLESGRLAGTGLVLRTHRDAALSLLEEGSALLRESRIEDCPAGVVTQGARVELAHCALSGLGKIGVELKGPGHLLRSTAISAQGTGLWVGQGSVEARDLETSCGKAGAAVDSGGSLDWKGGSWKGGEVGLHVIGGEALLEGVRGQDARQGVRLEAGRLGGRGLKLGGHRDVGLVVLGDARGILDDCVFQDCPVGVLATGGALELSSSSFLRCSSVCCSLEKGTHSLKGCFFDPACRDVLLGPGAKASRDRERGRGPDLRGVLWRLVLKTRRVAPLRWVYRAVYTAAVAWVRAWSRVDPKVVTSLVHRGWVTGDWQPGVSDLDFILLVDRLADAAWLKEFWRSYERWRRWFPFLGEVLVAETSDAECYLRFGGRRAGELRPQSRLLAGRALPAAEGSGDPSTLHECAHAYTRLMQWSLPSGRAPREFDQAQFFKARVDLLRYAAAARGPVLSRAQAGASLREEEPASGALCAELLRRYHGSAGAARAAEDSSYRWVSPAAANAAAWDGLERLKGCFGAALGGVFADDLYRTYIVLEDAAVEGPALESLLEQWERQRRAERWTGTLPIVLSRRLWELWRRLPYLESPVRFLEFQGPASAGAWFGDCRQYSWGAPGAPGGVSDAAVLDAALECAANLRLHWRLLGSPGNGLSAAYILHYLLSRTLGLRLLLERRVGASFFDLDRLVGLYRDHFPEEGKALDRLRPQEWLHSPQGAFFEHYGFLDERIREVARL